MVELPVLLIVGSEPIGKKKYPDPILEKEMRRKIRLMHQNGWHFCAAEQSIAIRILKEMRVQYRGINITQRNAKTIVNQMTRVLCLWDTIDNFPMVVFAAACTTEVPATLLAIADGHIHFYQSKIIPPPSPSMYRSPTWFAQVVSCLTHSK